MARALGLILLLALLAPASCLRCKSCRGEFGCAVETEVTCGEGESSCRTAVRGAAVSFLRFQRVSKGCARRSRPDEAVTLSSHLLALSYSAAHCPWDGCNDQHIVAPELAPPNQLHCHACTSQGDWCPPSARTQLWCKGAQDQCLDLDISGSLGEFTNMKLKGCASLPRCQDGLGFHTDSRAIHARCCNTPLCNHLDTDFHVAAEPHNGLRCYSCVDEDGDRCTSSSTSTVPCTGHHNMCLEGIGHSRSGVADSVLVTFKGCATPAMCQSSLLALVQELDDAEVYCCTGSLCNTRIMDGKVAEGRPSLPASLPTSLPASLPTSLPHSPSPTPEPDCIPEEEDVVTVAGVLPPSAGRHSDREAETDESSEGRGWEDGGDSVGGGHPMSHAGGQAITPHSSHGDEVLAAEGAGHSTTNSPSLSASGGSGTSNATESHAGSARESFVAEGAAPSSPDHGSPGSRTDAIVPILSRQNESFFSEDKEVGSSSASAAPVSPTGTILAAGGAGVGSHRGKNKTLCTKRPGVAPVIHGLSSHDNLAQGGPSAHAGTPETVAKPGGSLERTEGDRDWPNVSFPITVETHNSSLRDSPGNASVPGLEENIVKNTSSWIYTNTPVIMGKPRPPYPSGAFSLSGHLGLVTLTVLLTVLLH